MVNISGGVADNNFGVWGGVANVSGGTIESFYVWPGGVANISGGTIGTGVYGLNVNRDTLVNITGGRINGGIAYDESVLNISGGVIADELDIRSGSLTSFYGGEFRLDGELVAGLSNPGDAVPINVPAGAILSGTLADGTPFVFTSDDEDSFADGTITLRAAVLPAIGPAQNQIARRSGSAWHSRRAEP